MCDIRKEKYEKIYDLLVSVGGADESDKQDFVYHHFESKNGCREWRFCGKFGFGGKYRSETNTVTLYPEDKTPERVKLIKKINQELSKI